MTDFLKALPEWNNAGVEPDQTKKDAGWGVEEKPPADWFNWLQYTGFHALQELQQYAVHKDDFNAHKAETMQPLSEYKSGYDSTEKLYTVIELKRSNGTLYKKSTLSNKNVDGQYETRTEEHYETDGLTIKETIVFTLTYDTSGNVISEVVQ